MRFLFHLCQRFSMLVPLTFQALFDVGGCFVHCRIFNNTSDLYQLNVISTLPHICDNQKCPQTLPNVGGGGQSCLWLRMVTLCNCSSIILSPLNCFGSFYSKINCYIHVDFFLDYLHYAYDLLNYTSIVIHQYCSFYCFKIRQQNMLQLCFSFSRFFILSKIKF